MTSRHCGTAWGDVPTPKKDDGRLRDGLAQDAVPKQRKIANDANHAENAGFIPPNFPPSEQMPQGLLQILANDGWNRPSA